MYLEDTDTAVCGDGGKSSSRSISGYSIQVLTYDRPGPLLRLLKALQEAEYDTATVDLRVWVDGASTWRSSQKSSRDEVEAIARQVRWPHGDYQVVVRRPNKGLLGQWFGCCGDLDVTTRWVVFEDDLEPSRQWFRWFKMAWQTYKHYPHLAAISLCRQHLVACCEYIGSESLEVNNGNEPYLYKLPGSWGFSPNPVVWKEFLEWYNMMEV